MTVLLVAVAGAVGAPARYVIDAWIDRRVDGRFPWGILVVNALGCLILGLLVGLHRAGHLDSTPLTVLGTGFCGAFTTFSTHALQTVELAEDGERRPAAYNVVSMAALCIGLGGTALALASLT